MEVNERLLFINAFNERLSELLYSSGDLFIMPSSYEPCGISQMIAMRFGQPCIVHAVGGLRDTVIDDSNGFSFDGETILEQAGNLVQTLERAFKIFFEETYRWEKIRGEARNSRFTWDVSAEQYENLIYSPLS